MGISNGRSLSLSEGQATENTQVSWLEEDRGTRASTAPIRRSTTSAAGA